MTIAKANTSIAASTLPFAQRVELVRKCIRHRAKRVPRQQQPAYVARLWVSWLNREVLL